MQSDKIYTKTVIINAPVSKVWHTLTDPSCMKRWMHDDAIHILTDWTVGSPMVIEGILHGLHFKNNGTVLKFNTGSSLQYSHLSSLSALPDETQNYSVIEFDLTPTNYQTTLTLTLSNFPTETIYKHLELYWKATLQVFKNLVETH
jgi:uncharacterized protein YndB with AHSA1/START domain